LKEVEGPVVLGGDLNTTGVDGSPTSVRYEVMKRLTDKRFWVKTAIDWFSPVKVLSFLAWPVNYWKNFRDPTAINLPILAPNREQRLFEILKDFHFADGGTFDFGGSRTLGNTNERGKKGFKPTFRFERNYRGLVGVQRLDWLLLKRAPMSPGSLEILTPRNPRTLTRLNGLLPDRLSDHEPITLDLRLEPAVLP
jgi:hypothetical protein